jgi:alpha-mannosidase
MPTRTEADVLREILPPTLYDRIPDIIQGTTRLALLMQSSHLDYDWIGTFWQNLRYGFDGRNTKSTADFAIQNVLDNAAALVSVPDSRFTFSIAEMRFLQEAIAHNPSLQRAFQDAGPRFDILGAAVETPDAILPEGEAYIRCYLQGYLWAVNAFPTTDLLSCAWLPDSFGFCSSLPILYNAMGIGAVGLQRFPGSVEQGTASQYMNGKLAPYLYAQKQIDFQWVGADGAPLLVHWLQNTYNQDFATVKDLGTRLTGAQWDGNALVAATQYCLVPIGNDLACPDANLATIVDEWNSGPPRGTNPDQLVAAGTVAQYIELLGFHQDKILPVDLRQFPPTPYWTGFYAMRPGIKQLQRRGTMAALAAEAFGALALLAPDVYGTSELQPTIDAAWSSLAIGTSHNILTGCAPDLTTYAEQRPFLDMACGGAERTRDAVVTMLAQATWNTVYTGSGWPVVVFQQNSVPVGPAALAEYVPDPALGIDFSTVTSIALGNANVSTPVQQSSDQTLLFQATVPALGYQQGAFATTPPNSWLGELVFGTVSPGVFFLQNQYLRAEIGDDGRILQLVDRQTNGNVLSGAGNDLVFYTDTGNIYRFGNELSSFWHLYSISAAWGSPARTVLETGPVRLRVRCEATATVDNNNGPSTNTYVREYSLVAGEPFLRITTSGVAPAETSMFTMMPLSAGIDGVQYGTMAHWDDLLPQPPCASEWPPPYFFASHDFVVTMNNGTPTAAVYHECMPCWSRFNLGGLGDALMGCLSRNPRAGNDAYGAGGADFDRFTQVYALRVGSGLQPADSLQPLIEARTFNAPMQTRVVRPISWPSGTGPVVGTPLLEPQYSLASITQGTAYITAAKVRSGGPPEELILRIYTPAPGQPVQVTLGGSPRADDSTMTINTVAEVTALELPVTPGIPITLMGNLAFGFTPTRCLTTVAVTFLSSGGSDAHPCGSNMRGTR